MKVGQKLGLRLKNVMYVTAQEAFNEFFFVGSVLRLLFVAFDTGTASADYG